jgi:hypothetical protein
VAGMTNQNKVARRTQPVPATHAALSDAERLQSAMDQIERLRAEMRLDAAFNKIERAADALLFAAKA